jgi:HEAT repeat protein
VCWIAAETLGALRVEAKAVIPALMGMVETGTGRVPRDDITFLSFEEVGQLERLGWNDKGCDQLRIAAIQALAGFRGDAAEAVPDLVRALRDEELRVRWFAAEAVGLIGPDAKAAVPALVEALRFWDVATSEGGVEMLHDGDPKVRANALEILGQMIAKAAVPIPVLVRCLNDRDPEVREAAATDLASAGNRPEAVAAIPRLVAALWDQEELVSNAARNALCAIARPALPRSS